MSIYTSSQQERFRFIYNALNAAGGFADGTYLIRYPRESAEKYERRQQLAWYRNHLRSACNNFVGYLSKRPPIRDITNPLLQRIVDDADMKDNCLDIFWQQFMIDAKARGSMLLLIDMPQEIPGDQATQIEQRAVPYFSAICPENVTHFEIDRFGNVEKIEVLGLWSTTNFTSQIALFGWDKTSWWVSIDGAIQDAGEHNLGFCPVLIFTEAGLYPHVGEFAQIADMSRRYYNACSERDEILRSQTFSLLTYHIPPDQAGQFSAGAVAEAVGTHNMLIHHGDAPAFIAPPDGPATIYGNVLAELDESIKRIALTVEQPTQAESGVARALRFQQLNSALVSFASRMEDLEERAWYVVAKYLNLQDAPIHVEWQKDYSLADVEAELAELQQMQASAFPPEAIAAKQKQIAGLTLPNIDPDFLQRIFDMIGAEHSTNENPALQQSYTE